MCHGVTFLCPRVTFLCPGGTGTILSDGQVQREDYQNRQRFVLVLTGIFGKYV